jgi:CRP-like cAMP-binding protein
MLADLYGTPTPKGMAIRYHFSQEDLANMIGVTRQWVSNALCRLQKEQVIEHRNRNLLIRDLAHLRTLASADEGRSPLTGGHARRR